MFCSGGISDWWTVDEDCHLNLSWYRTPDTGMVFTHYQGEAVRHRPSSKCQHNQLIFSVDKKNHTAKHLIN